MGKQEPAIAILNGDARPAQPLVFSREVAPADLMQQQYEEKLAAALAPIRKAGFAEQIEVDYLRTRSAKAVELAYGDLRTFEEQVQAWIRIGLATAIAALLLVSVVLMGIGQYRILRAHKLATPAFGSAFACLAACLGMWFFGTWLGPVNIALFVPLARAARVGSSPGVGKCFRLAPPVRAIAAKPFIAPMHPLAAMKMETANVTAKTDGGGSSSTHLHAMARAFAPPSLGELDRTAEALKRRQECRHGCSLP